MASADFEDFFGAGTGGGVGIFPRFTPKRMLNSYASGSPEGFVGDDDYFTLPTTTGAAAALAYFNNAGASQWSHAPTAIHANCTSWMTFSLDSVDALLWVVALDDVNDVLYTATINAAGTIVNVGNASATANLSNVADGWIGNTSNRKAASMIRAVEGTGNFTVYGSSRDYVINYTNGALVSETNKVNGVAGAFVATSGARVNIGDIAALSDASNINGTQQRILIRKELPSDANRFSTETLFAPTHIGLPNSQNANGDNNYGALQWNGDVLLINAGTTLGAIALYDTVEFLASVDKLIENMRIDV